MAWFIKTEKFTPKTLQLRAEDRRVFIKKHKRWVAELNALGTKIISGYLVDKDKIPGGGGVLIIEANSYEEAIALIRQDPMIAENLVVWEIHEWIPIWGKLIK